MRFEHPHLLWLLPVLPVLVSLFLWRSHRIRRRLLTQFVQARLLPELTIGISTGRQRAHLILLSSATALFVLALARPQWGFTWEEARQRGLDIVVAIDTSKSMLAEDIQPNRLERAKLAALDLMQQARADRLAVVAFAGGAFLQCPLTLDDAAFRQCIDELDVDIIPQGGTALAEAIRVTTRAFEENDNFKVLVLFTDGEDHDPGALEAAREASEAGLRIFTVGLGTTEGEILRIRDETGKLGYVRDSAGQAVKSRLNETILQQVAGAAQGFYLPLRGADTVDTLYAKGLAPLPKSESEARLFQRYHEQYHWPLGVSILLLLLDATLPERRRDRSRSTRSITRAVAAVVMLGTAFLPTAGQASPTKAMRQYEAGNYVEALEAFDKLREERGADPRLHYNAGAAAFRARRFEDAADRYGLATGAQDLELQQRAYYDRGNALYRVGEEQPDLNAKKEAWQRAIADYESALKLNAEDQDAQFNLEFVKKRLEELEQQQQQNQDQQDNQQSEQQDQKEQQDNQSSDSDQSQDQQPENNSSQQQDNAQDQDQDQGQPNQQEERESEQRPDESEDQQSSAEQPQQPAEESEPSDGSEQDAQTGEAQPQQPSNLTPEQAAQLLDGLKGEEQMLPIRLMTPQPTEPPERDW